MTVQMISIHGFNAVRLTNRDCAAQALIATQGARPLTFWPKGEESGFSALYVNPAKPLRSTHICWPNFARLSLRGDGSDIKLDKAGNPADAGIYGKYSLAEYGLGEEVRTLEMHGPSRTEEWKVAELEENRAVMTYHHLPNEHYPFEAKLAAQAMIKPDGSFFYDVTATNHQAAEMVTDLAIHTYLSWLPGMTIDGIQHMDYFEGSDWIRSLPKTFSPNENRFEMLTPLERHLILKGRGLFRINYPSIGQNVRYEVFGDPVHPEQMVLWADPNEGEFLCVEPVLRERNSLNKGTAYINKQGRSISVGFSLKFLT